VRFLKWLGDNDVDWHYIDPGKTAGRMPSSESFQRSLARRAAQTRRSSTPWMDCLAASWLLGDTITTNVRPPLITRKPRPAEARRALEQFEGTAHDALAQNDIGRIWKIQTCKTLTMMREASGQVTVTRTGQNLQFAFHSALPARSWAQHILGLRCHTAVFAIFCPKGRGSGEHYRAAGRVDPRPYRAHYLSHPERHKKFAGRVEDRAPLIGGTAIAGHSKNQRYVSRKSVQFRRGPHSRLFGARRNQFYHPVAPAVWGWTPASGC